MKPRKRTGEQIVVGMIFGARGFYHRLSTGPGSAPSQQFLLPCFGALCRCGQRVCYFSARSSCQPEMFASNITMALILKSRIENRRTD
jgi:hypothetical protein